MDMKKESNVLARLLMYGMVDESAMLTYGRARLSFFVCVSFVWSVPVNS